MQRERLTPDRIRRFSCPDGVKQAFLWDTDAPRLAVRATAGSKAFIFEGKLQRQTIRRTIGAVSAWNIDDARAEARRLQTLLDQGIDPREQDRQKAEAKAAAVSAAEQSRQEAESRQRYTLTALFGCYTEMLKAQGKTRSAKSALSAFKCHIEEAFPSMAEKPAGDVTPLEIAAAVRKVHEAGKVRMSGILRSYLNAAYNAAKRAPFDPSLPSSLIPFAITHNPVDAIPAVPVNAGQRTLTVEELQQYMTKLGQGLDDQALLLALRCGGQRMAQLLRAKASDYDPTSQTLRLWDGKGKRRSPREHLLPLGPIAAAQVEDLIARAKTAAMEGTKGSRQKLDLTGLWLFSTHGKVAMIPETPGKRLAAISKEMGGEPFDLRDIRRTVETLMAGMKISKDDRAQVLSHGISGVQSVHYDRHGYADEKRAALRSWERKLDAISRGVQMSADVIPLHGTGQAR